ncbi:MAG: DUF790 family protein [Fusobacteriaceae bacterium]|nr:DUF790 family protein [Fusobacteriaceae bacterium]
MSILKQCQNCKEKFYIRPCLAKKRKYCSQQCYFDFISKHPKQTPNYKHGNRRNNQIARNKKCSCGKKILYFSKRCHIRENKRRTGKNSPRFGKSSHGKWEKYKGIWMRSSYEVIYAKWLDFLKIKWIYEPKAFDLGNSTYTPDFYLPKRKTYIEVKGWWRPDAKKKYKQFKKLYSNLRILLIVSSDIKKIKSDLDKSKKRKGGKNNDYYLSDS